MLEPFKIFDPYSLRARLFPALIAGLPTLALLFVLVPWNHVGQPHAIALAAATVLVFASADVARRAGLRVEKKLRTRATPELLHHDNTVLDQESKRRYKAFLAGQLGVAAPSDADEITDRNKADQFYLSAGNWLREQTRDTRKYRLLFEEVITYGFRRNLLGLKPISLALNTVVVIASSLVLLYGGDFFSDITALRLKLGMVIVAALLHSAYMAFAVGPAAVRDASAAYGRQLVLSCEILMSTNKPAVSQTARTAKATTKPVP